jgi:hypothetical protein
MVDTTNAIASNEPVSDLSEAGAPEIEITSAMIDAGERAIFASDVWPNLCLFGWSSDLAEQVYRAMEGARLTKRHQ